MSVSIGIDNVAKKYGDMTIIPDLSAFIKNGEFFTLLGPSGCGKTTLLRMIAGFNSIEGGSIKFDGKVINDIPAQKRNIGMVFQSYAIFPHLTVRQNVEYGLKIRKVPKEHMKERVDEILKAVKIDEYQDRLPERLSGGQQQRVALARAIVIHFFIVVFPFFSVSFKYTDAPRRKKFPGICQYSPIGRVSFLRLHLYRIRGMIATSILLQFFLDFVTFRKRVGFS